MGARKEARGQGVLVHCAGRIRVTASESRAPPCVAAAQSTADARKMRGRGRATFLVIGIAGEARDCVLAVTLLAREAGLVHVLAGAKVAVDAVRAAQTAGAWLESAAAAAGRMTSR